MRHTCRLLLLHVAIRRLAQYYYQTFQTADPINVYTFAVFSSQQ